MTRLTEQEKKQLLAAAGRKAPRPPRVPARTAQEFVSFASFASTFAPAPKPVRFEGRHWKL